MDLVRRMENVYVVRIIFFGIISILVRLSPVLASKILFRLKTGKILNLENPRDFNEKLQWLKLYWRHPLVSKCADKYEVREYIKSCGCEEILNQLYGVYEDAREIDWDQLPEKFVLKATHGCGWNIICNDKSKLDKEKAKKQLNQWLKVDLSLHAAELHYGKIKPKIISERYIETDAGFFPIDYKVFCFNGEPKVVRVTTDRGSGFKLSHLNLNWEELDIEKKEVKNEKIPKKPACYNQMLDYAKKLSAPFPFVRVDFYDFQGKPIFGEMTFTPSACMATYFTEKGLKILGDMLELPEKYIKEN